MKKIVIMLMVCCVLPTVTAQPTLEVYESDGQTVFNGHDLMVGSKLKFIVSQDSTDYWSGGLFIANFNTSLGTLTATDYDPNIPYWQGANYGDWQGAHYSNAGEYAKVTGWKDSERRGFDLYGSDEEEGSSVGNWFVINYEAIEEGEPNVWFCDYDVSWKNPVSFQTFTQVPSRDFNDDDIVDLADFSTFKTFWLSDDCQDPNWCGKTDLDRDGEVDTTDLSLFAEYWLWQAEYRPEIIIETITIDDPNEPAPTPDIDFIYSITDPNGLDEITLTVGHTITLYVNMAAIDPNAVLNIVDIEVDISDPNLGSIDNTEYDGGTAQILAEPRADAFDYWGPGTEQYEGIELFCVNIGDSISEGQIASFEFTCQGPGDVTLTLVNWGFQNALLQEMLIHQIESQVDFLERIWNEDSELQLQYTEEEWNAFVDSTRNPE
ncbi:MAG: hypothetical protein JW912_03600 [Sedimentisphaerales bacterium]|nr:hypothetical protein [Sedimentisphaerales bacterium]